MTKLPPLPDHRKPWRAFLVLLLIASLSLAAVLPARAQTSTPPPRSAPRDQPPIAEPEIVAGEIMVRFKSGVSNQAIQQARQEVEAEYIQNLYESPVQLWRVAEGDELAVVAQLSKDPNVQYAEPNYVVRALETTLTPNDPYYPDQWGHPKINSPAAWDLSTGSASFTVAVIDTGIDLDHPDLASKIIAGYDYVEDDSVADDQNGHGTHVAGIAAAVGNNGIGVAGVDWQARLMPVRVLDASGSGNSGDVISGINWAYQHGAHVLNLSLGSYSYSQGIQDAVTAAWNAGSLVIAAMGNDDTTSPHYPAAMANVMAVAATNSSDQRAWFSNRGSHCDIAAPGEDIYSTIINGYGYKDGTSMATPFVAGLAALLWSMAPSLTNAQVQQTIQNNAVDLGPAGWDDSFGWGRINAYETLNDYSIPSAPTLLAISNGDKNGDYLVDWNPAGGSTSYLLQEDDNPDFISPTTRYSGPNTNFNVIGQGAGTWYYRVRGSNSYGDGPWSSTQSAGVLPVALNLNAISNPSNLDTYTISWNALSGVTAYTLEEDDNNSFASPEVRYKGLATSYAVTGQPPGAWYYRVRANSTAGDGPWSNLQSTSVNASGVSAPNLLVIDNNDHNGSYLVDWSDVGGATSYLLEQSGSPYFEAPNQIYNGSTSQFQVDNQPGGVWYYRVRTVASGGQSQWSSKQSASVYVDAYLPIVRKKPSTSNGLPINEGFEGGQVPPSGWTLIQTNTNQTWIIDSFEPNSGSYDADIEYDAALNQQNEVLISPPFSSSTGAILHFYSFGSVFWCRDTYNNCDLKVWIVIGEWGGGDDIHVYTADSDWPDDWLYVQSTVDLSAYIGSSTVRVAFQYVGVDGAEAGLDDINISAK